MRNLLLFVLFLVGLFFVRRALRRTLGGLAGRKEEGFGSGAGGAAGARPGAEAPREMLEAEQMVACAHCGLHVPESEGVRGSAGFFCSEEHRRLGVRS